MGQIVRRKKKGRPSKAYLAHRAGESPAGAAPPPPPDLRRSMRRRNVRYNIEYDDYLEEDDDDDDDDGDERRREKKLKLVVKLNQDKDKDDDDSVPTRTRASARGAHSRGDSSEDETERKPMKKRKVGEEDEEEEEEEEGGDCNEDENDNEEDENVREDDDVDGVVKGRKVDSKGLHSVSGTPLKSSSSGIPLPDKRSLELILDKLQKKDTYGVYAEPVDPEELPDYHDVIDHPMDFATVRKKLANGSYPTLEQFESDVFLICTNAMQYNSSDTIYHKQARSIQELARKKFEKLRVDFENSQSEQKSDQKARSNSLGKKPTKKPLGHVSQEPVGSDFSAGATLANIGDVPQPTSYPIPGGSYERPCNNDGLVDVNGFLIDANHEKAEDFLSGKSLLSKLGRKPFASDDNRRGSYNASIQPVAKSDSVFMTFENEVKQLVTVGLHAEYSYSRSLARFAATLGPVAWKIASRKIQQALPSGSKFGRGWVGEYEPLPTPVIMVDKRNHKEHSFVSKFPSTESGKGDKNGKTSESPMNKNVHGIMLERKQPSIDAASRPTSEGKPSLFGSAGIRPNAPANVLYQQQNVQPRGSGKPENKGMKQVELNSLPSSNQNNANLSAKFLGNAPPGISKPREMVPRNMNILPPAPFKDPDANGVASGDFPNGKVTNPSLNRRVTGPPSESTSNQTGRAGPFVPHGQDQTLTDPVQLMRMLAEKSQKQQASSNPSPVDTPPMTPSVSSGRRDDLGNAAAAAARAWMSVGAGGYKQGSDSSSSPKNQISADSLYNPSREFHQPIPRTRGEFPSGGMHFQPEKNNFPFQALVSQPIHPGSVSPFPNRPMGFPQLAAADLSRFQMQQSAWQGPSPHGQSRQKPETLPPDLNIGFQSPGSPAKQSSGVMVDSQQPDLALQL